MKSSNIEAWRGWPVVTLLLLAPMIAEIVFGSTGLSNLGALPLEIGMYGGGSLLIREVIRRRGGRWPTLLALGAAYGVVEEGLTEPTWFTTQLFGGHAYGMAGGVYWLYAGYDLGYHAVWSVTVPILVTELLFPRRRSEPWLGRIGLGAITAVYVLDCAATAILWREVIVPSVFHVRQEVGPLYLIAAGVVAVALAGAGWWLSAGAWNRARPREATPPPAPVLLALALAGALAWFFLDGGGRALRLRFEVPLLADAALVAGAAILAGRWSRLRGWSDRHRLAVLAGLLVGQMAGGFKINASLLEHGSDLWLKVGADAVALILLGLMVRSVANRSTPASSVTSWPVP